MPAIPTQDRSWRLVVLAGVVRDDDLPARARAEQPAVPPLRLALRRIAGRGARVAGASARLAGRSAPITRAASPAPAPRARSPPPSGFRAAAAGEQRRCHCAASSTRQLVAARRAVAGVPA